MSQSSAAGSWGERLCRLAAEFNESLGSVACEVYAYEAGDRAIVLEVVKLGQAALLALDKAQKSSRAQRARNRQFVVSKWASTIEASEDRHVVILERLVEFGQVHCVYLLYVVCGTHRQTCIVHGVSGQDTVDVLRQDMDAVLGKLET